MPAIKATDELIDGFQSPLGMEALATVDWLSFRLKPDGKLRCASGFDRLGHVEFNADQRRPREPLDGQSFIEAGSAIS